MNLENTINNAKDVIVDFTQKVNELQTEFMQSNLYKIINNGLDFSLRMVLPDFIENDIIEIKDIMFENGLYDGVNECVSRIKEFGKTVLGLATRQF